MTVTRSRSVSPQPEVGAGPRRTSRVCRKTSRPGSDTDDVDDEKSSAGGAPVAKRKHKNKATPAAEDVAPAGRTAPGVTTAVHANAAAAPPGDAANATPRAAAAATDTPAPAEVHSSCRAAFNPVCLEQRKIIVVAAALYVCIGNFYIDELEPDTRKRQKVENVAPWGFKAKNVKSIMQECAELESARYPKGYSVSQF
jgi:hypothetical protein